MAFSAWLPTPVNAVWSVAIGIVLVVGYHAFASATFARRPRKSHKAPDEYIECDILGDLSDTARAFIDQLYDEIPPRRIVPCADTRHFITVCHGICLPTGGSRMQRDDLFDNVFTYARDRPRIACTIEALETAESRSRIVFTACVKSKELDALHRDLERSSALRGHLPVAYPATWRIRVAVLDATDESREHCERARAAFQEAVPFDLSRFVLSCKGHEYMPTLCAWK
jgi:hypothetical protein